MTISRRKHDTVSITITTGQITSLAHESHDQVIANTLCAHIATFVINPSKLCKYPSKSQARCLNIRLFHPDTRPEIMF